MSELKKRGNGTTVAAAPSSIWDKLGSTNFILNLILLLGGTMVAFPSEQAQALALNVIGSVSLVGVLRTYLKNAQFDLKAWALNSNTYAYLGSILMTFGVSLTPEFFTGLQNLVQAIVSGNWQGILVAVFSLSSIIYNLVRK